MNESNKIISDLTGKEYYPHQVFRIVNILQAIFYMSKNVLPLDIYPSLDYKTNKPILVFIYAKKDTTEVYKQWCDRKVNWEELQNER